MFVKQIQIESLGNSTYIVGDEEAKVCAVVDAGLTLERSGA